MTPLLYLVTSLGIRALGGISVLGVTRRPLISLRPLSALRSLDLLQFPERVCSGDISSLGGHLSLDSHLGTIIQRCQVLQYAQTRLCLVNLELHVHGTSGH